MAPALGGSYQHNSARIRNAMYPDNTAGGIFMIMNISTDCALSFLEYGLSCRCGSINNSCSAGLWRDLVNARELKAG